VEELYLHLYEGASVNENANVQVGKSHAQEVLDDRTLGLGKSHDHEEGPLCVHTVLVVAFWNESESGKWNASASRNEVCHVRSWAPEAVHARENEIQSE